MRKTTLSQNLIKEFKNELYDTYGLFIDDCEAETFLRSLTRSMFPTVIAEQMTESRESGQGKVAVRPACVDSLSVMLGGDGGHEVGASITPTSGHRDKKYE